tara:strand:+ start:135 stop:422 length:288 start_codon:yes stop_codon:yes gene_type:complete
MINSFFFVFFLFICNIILADEIEIPIILENCKGCHGYNFKGNKYIESLLDIEKSEFISKMNDYKYSDDNYAMNRISKVLTEDDIKKIAELIYDKK